MHEKDTEYLARSRCAAEYCAAHLAGPSCIAPAGDNMRSIEDIQAESAGDRVEAADIIFDKRGHPDRCIV